MIISDNKILELDIANQGKIKALKLETEEDLKPIDS